MKPAPPDTELMARVGRGDQDAFEEIFRRHHGQVVAFFYRYRGERSQAEDLAQDVFLRLWRYRGSYQPTGSFMGYLLTMARNVWFDKSAKHSAQIIDEEILDARPAPGPGPGDLAAGNEARDRVRLAVLDLPEGLRAPLVLSRFHGMGYREIADVLEISPRTVEARVARATDALVRRLTGGAIADVAADPDDAARAGGAEERS